MTAALPDNLRTRAFINGEFLDSADGATFDSLAPATGQVIATVAACAEADVDRGAGAARASFDRGPCSHRPPSERKTVLLRFAELIEAHLDELAATESIDAGKPISDCRTFDFPAGV